jgi:hypothetical protein
MDLSGIKWIYTSRLPNEFLKGSLEPMIPQPINAPINCDQYELLETYVCPISGVVVDKGFIYDGASIPRALWTITGIRPDGGYRAGATVHDWIYRHKGRVRVRNAGIEKPAAISRSEADRIFRRLMADSGVSAYRAWLAWSGVRLFGWAPWNNTERG